MRTHQKNEKSLFRVIMENYDTLFFHRKFQIFSHLELLEPEYLKNKNFKLQSLLQLYYVVSYFFP